MHKTFLDYIELLQYCIINIMLGKTERCIAACNRNTNLGLGASKKLIWLFSSSTLPSSVYRNTHKQISLPTESGSLILKHRETSSLSSLSLLDDFVSIKLPSINTFLCLLGCLGVQWVEPLTLGFCSGADFRVERSSPQ